jgi:hypothetical protein
VGVARGPGRIAFLVTALLVTLAGCVSFSVRTTTTGAASVEDLQAENAYVAVYMDHMTKLRTSNKAFAPSGANPGVCNKGGNQQACFDADVQAINNLKAMLSALKATSVPPRFVEADRLLRDAVTKDMNGLVLRNQAIALSDNALWKQHAQALQDAQVAWSAAYDAFPADNRPPLRP